MRNKYDSTDEDLQSDDGHQSVTDTEDGHDMTLRPRNQNFQHEPETPNQELNFEATKFESRIAFEDVYGDHAGPPPQEKAVEEKEILRSKVGKLEYVPLVLLKEEESKGTTQPSSKAIFKEHIGNPNLYEQEKGSFRSLDLD